MTEFLQIHISNPNNINITSSVKYGWEDNAYLTYPCEEKIELYFPFLRFLIMRYMGLGDSKSSHYKRYFQWRINLLNWYQVSVNNVLVLEVMCSKPEEAWTPLSDELIMRVRPNRGGPGPYNKRRTIEFWFQNKINETLSLIYINMVFMQFQFINICYMYVCYSNLWVEFWISILTK